MWQPVALAGTVSDRIAQQILTFIRTEEVKAGDRLPSERELAALLGSSRLSVREAVKALEAQGWLRVRHGLGVFVASPEEKDQLRADLARQDLTPGELFLMREVLEVPAAAWAASARDHARIAAVAAALDDLNLAVAATPPDLVRVQQLDAAFHMRIVEATDNRYLRQTLAVLQSMLAWEMRGTSLIPGRLARARAEHQRILDALRRGDSAGARNAARRHIRNSQAAALLRAEARSADLDLAVERLTSGQEAPA